MAAWLHDCCHQAPQPTGPCLFAAQDYINFQLTGRMVGSLNNASVRWHYSTDEGWPTSLLEKLGLAELQQKWPQELVAPGEHCRPPPCPALSVCTMQVLRNLTIASALHCSLLRFAALHCPLLCFAQLLHPCIHLPSHFPPPSLRRAPCLQVVPWEGSQQRRRHTWGSPRARRWRRAARMPSSEWWGWACCSRGRWPCSRGRATSTWA